jgi:hypothetical protein
MVEWGGCRVERSRRLLAAKSKRPPLSKPLSKQSDFVTKDFLVSGGFDTPLGKHSGLLNTE